MTISEGNVGMTMDYDDLLVYHSKVFLVLHSINKHAYRNMDKILIYIIYIIFTFVVRIY